MSGYCATGSVKTAIAAGQRDDDRQHRGEDRPVDEELARTCAGLLTSVHGFAGTGRDRRVGLLGRSRCRARDRTRYRSRTSAVERARGRRRPPRDRCRRTAVAGVGGRGPRLRPCARTAGARGRSERSAEHERVDPADRGELEDPRLAEPVDRRRRTRASGRCRTAVTPSIPLKTVVPSVRRISAPAPWPRISGTTPRMNASDVITIGRSRSRQASSAACRRGLARVAVVLGELDDQDRVLARQADQHDEADLREDVDVLAGDLDAR